MTESVKTKITCPKCKHSSSYEKYIEIDVDDTPQIREAILDMSFFSFICGHCTYKMRLLYPVCYRDEEYKILLFFVNNDEAQQSKEFEGYRARIIKTADSFREKIKCFELGFDDRAMELLKLLLKSQYEQNATSDLEEVFFYDIDENGNQIFVLVKNDGTQETIGVLPVYYLNILDEIETKLSPSWKCQCIDEEYAKEITRTFF